MFGSIFVGLLLVLAFVAYAGYELYGSKIKSTLKSFLPLMRVAGVGAGALVLLYLYFTNAHLFYSIMESILPTPMHRAIGMVASGGNSSEHSWSSVGGSVEGSSGSSVAASLEDRFPYLRNSSVQPSSEDPREQPARVPGGTTGGSGGVSGGGSGSIPDRSKRSVSAAMKKRVAARQQWKCAMCGNTLDETYEVDHEVALYMGGTNDIENLRLVIE